MKDLLRLMFRKRDKVRSARGRAKAPTRRLALEGLEARALLTIVVPIPGTPGPATITGTSGADQFVIRLEPGTPANIQFSDDGGTSFTTSALADITKVDVSGLDGRDTLTIDNGNGLVAEIAGLPISFDGGAGRDTLVLKGDPGGTSVTEVYTVGATSDSATLKNDNGTASQSISLTGLENIVDTSKAASLTINFDDNPNFVHIRNGGLIDGVRTNTVQGAGHDDDDEHADGNFDDEHGNGHGDEHGNGHGHDDGKGGKNAFVPITFANKTDVTVNTLGGIESS